MTNRIESSTNTDSEESLKINLNKMIRIRYLVTYNAKQVNDALILLENHPETKEIITLILEQFEKEDNHNLKKIKTWIKSIIPKRKTVSKQKKSCKKIQRFGTLCKIIMYIAGVLFILKSFKKGLSEPILYIMALITLLYVLI